MRALFVVNNPGFGGGHNQIVRLREPLAARGWDVAMAVPRGAEAAPRMRAAGVDVIELTLHRLRATPDPRVQLPFLRGLAPEVNALRRLIRDGSYDVVQPHGDTNPHAAIAGHREGVAVSWELYDTRTPVPLRRVTMPLVTRLADTIMTVGAELGRVHPGTEGFGERWIKIWPPVDDRVFRPDPARRAAARAELGIADGEVAVGAVGMLNPSKGFEYFVEALERVETPVAGRILGGASPAHSDYVESVRGRARALGTVEVRDAGARVPDLMPGLDVLVLSSVPRSEGVPTVILEAMACGIPVVATDVGAVSEAVEDGHTGYVVAPLDPGALADRINALAADPQLRARLGEQGLARFKRDFGIDELADRYVRAYELAREHRTRR